VLKKAKERTHFLQNYILLILPYIIHLKIID